MKNTSIQWCHSTINPVMGCDGCELWPAAAQINAETARVIETMRRDSTPMQEQEIRELVRAVVNDRTTSELYKDRDALADQLTQVFRLPSSARQQLIDVTRKACKCYAGLLGKNRAGRKGYADRFESPKLYLGRMAIAAEWNAPSQKEQAEKPWLQRTPRMIFISDMGDALSKDVPFEYLQQELIDVVRSAAGSRHLWLWLSKRPGRMAKFGQWLKERGIAWPENLVAMTTVTSAATVGRVNELRRVPSRFKGLSCEPVFSEIKLDLSGIDWVIMGGGSDTLAEPFDLGWASGMLDQCRVSKTGFFLKQLGKSPVLNGVPLVLQDRHGGEWNEWPEKLRVREIPDGFRGFKMAGQIADN